MRSRRPLSELTIDAVTDLFNRGFAGYSVKLSSDSAAMTRMIATDSIDLDAGVLARTRCGFARATISQAEMELQL